MATIGSHARQQVVQTLRFAAVGVCATAIYFFLGLALVKAKVPLMWALSIAYIVSITFSYIGQKIFTFGVRGEHRRVGPRFFAATAALAATQFLWVTFLHHTGATDIVALVASTFYYPIASYLVHTFWTFKARPQNKAADVK